MFVIHTSISVRKLAHKHENESEGLVFIQLRTGNGNHQYAEQCDEKLPFTL